MPWEFEINKYLAKHWAHCDPHTPWILSFYYVILYHISSCNIVIMLLCLFKIILVKGEKKKNPKFENWEILDNSVLILFCSSKLLVHFGTTK